MTNTNRPVRGNATPVRTPRAYPQGRAVELDEVDDLIFELDLALMTRGPRQAQPGETA